MAEETETTAEVQPVDYGEMSQEAYQAARAAGPLDTPPAVAAPETSPAETPADQAPVEETPAPADADDDEPTHSPRLQKRINTLTRQRKEAEAQAQTEREARLTIEAQLLALEQRSVRQPPQPAAPAPTAAPDPDNYESHDAYIVALTRYETHAAIAAVRQQDAVQADLVQRQAQADTARTQLASSIEAAREAYDDFDEVIDKATVVPGPLVSRAVAYNEHAGHVGYHLVSNPDELTRLNAITDGTKLLVELARIEAQLMPSTSSKPEKDPVPPGRPAPPTPVTPPVGDRGGGGVPKDPTSSQEAYQQWRRGGGGKAVG